MIRKCWSENLKESLGRPRHRWKLIFEWVIGKWGEDLWPRFMWLRIGISGELL